MGGIIIETFKFHLQFQINRNELRDEMFEIFFAIEIRAGFNNPVTINYICKKKLNNPV